MNECPEERKHLAVVLVFIWIMNVNLWNSMSIKVHLIHQKPIETISMG